MMTADMGMYGVAVPGADFSEVYNLFKDTGIDFSRMDMGDGRTYASPAGDTDPPANTGPSEADLQKQADDAAMGRQLQQQQYERDREVRQVVSTLESIFTEYGLASLLPKIREYAQQGLTADGVALMLRETPEYKQRFPAMSALSAKGRAITEAEYIGYERTASTLERQYGLPQGMLMGSVTNLLSNEVSLTELNDRVVMASAAAIQAPEDFKSQMRDYYGIDSGGLAGYFLDPAIATPLLEKQVASAQIGAEARRQGIGVDVYGAENLQMLGLSQEQARVGFGQVARQSSFSEGRGDVVSQQQLIAGNLAGDAQAQKDIERAAGGRLGRFQGGGEFLSTTQGAVGLGTAATR
jgi:hypothetical protein